MFLRNPLNFIVVFRIFYPRILQTICDEILTLFFLHVDIIEDTKVKNKNTRCFQLLTSYGICTGWNKMNMKKFSEMFSIKQHLNDSFWEKERDSI